MFQPGDRVLVAVSGGADSVSLLHILHELGYALEAAHFDHQTRNGESSADAAFTRELAAKLGVPFHLWTRPVEAEAKSAGLSFEEHARKARYEFLIEAARRRGCIAMATGHHADDQAETLLMRLLRGTTSSGLGGIPPLREEQGVRIVRPLIACPRETLLGYLATRGIEYRTDRTNTNLRYLRNRIRHRLLPTLVKEYNPKVREALVRLAEVEQSENDFVENQAKAFLERCLRPCGGLDRATFAAGHTALQRRAILQWAWRHAITCPFERVEAARLFIMEASAPRTFDLGGGLFLRNGSQTTDLVSATSHVNDRVVPLAVPGETAAFGKRFTIRCREGIPPEALAQYCSSTRQVFDADALGTALAVRHRRPGDRFTPLGMKGSKKLQDYLVDVKLPVHRRDDLLLLVAGDRIAWIVGHAISGHAAVTAETVRILEVEVADAAP
jgi:tRNA(Ile)-lysidine synthase